MEASYADKILEDVRQIATNYAIQQILIDIFIERISPNEVLHSLEVELRRRKVHFDEARKLSSSCGIEITEENR